MTHSLAPGGATNQEYVGQLPQTRVENRALIDNPANFNDIRPVSQQPDRGGGFPCNQQPATSNQQPRYERLKRGAFAAVTALGMALALGAMPLAAQAEVISFDDLTCETDANPSGTPVPATYKGLDWSNFWCVDGANRWGGNSGYNAGMVSSPNVVTNGFTSPAELAITAPASATINFNSVYLTGAWNDGLVVTIEASRGGSVVSTTTHTLSATAPTLVTLNLTDIDHVKFTSSGGTDHGYPDGDPVDNMGTQFAMDNLDIDIVDGPTPPPAGITAVPTLSEWSLLLLAGLLGAFGLNRQRRRG